MALFAGLLAPAAFAQVGTSSLLNPNLASKDELVAAGLDAAAAQAVMDQRPFLGMVPFHALVGAKLDQAKREALYRKMFIPLNLNTASKEEILLVPGVGNRMLHEFEEYRPYKALAQFHREIGKYVDDAELARLAQYVFVPLDLNTATREDFLTIPGVGDRMVREFLEYRPYKDLAQFRREIGKYVNDREVARLERYVVIR
jgi:DNA uptake protein ComE-like DNA-binding protein